MVHSKWGENGFKSSEEDFETYILLMIWRRMPILNPLQKTQQRYYDNSIVPENIWPPLLYCTQANLLRSITSLIDWTWMKEIICFDKLLVSILLMIWRRMPILSQLQKAQQRYYDNSIVPKNIWPPLLYFI